MAVNGPPRRNMKYGENSAVRCPSSCFPGDIMTPEEIALEFAEIFDELPNEQINEMLAKNVPFNTIKFFAEYAEAFADGAGIKGESRGRLPNLLLFGYLIRVLEERLLPEPS